ncbi:MAG: DUF559 domain-containing protein [Pseudonocardiaceae bacterium]|nr:MAG: DUF559 domain-containing protein [Pseudonocardiaceae bacterium]
MLDDLLRRQAGLVAVRQAQAHGVSPRTLQRRAAEAGWERLHPAVYLAAGHRITDEVRVRAAWLWAGDEATVCGPAAAYWHGMLPAAPEVVDVTLATSAGVRSRPGVRVRRRTLDHADRVGLRDVWVSAVPLTTLEAAVVLPDGSAFLDRALQRHVRLPTLHRAHSRNLGMRGSAAAGRLLAAAADGAGSAAERLLVRLLRGAAIEGWVLAHPFGPFVVDVAFPGARVAIEVDGWAWHVDAERFATDRRKGNALVAAGWTLLRFTWHDLTTAADRVLAEIRAALALMIAVSGG